MRGIVRRLENFPMYCVMGLIFRWTGTVRHATEEEASSVSIRGIDWMEL
jgi:hypothetical protein